MIRRVSFALALLAAPPALAQPMSSSRTVNEIDKPTVGTTCNNFPAIITVRETGVEFACVSNLWVERNWSEGATVNFDDLELTGDVTSVGEITAIGNDKITEPMLKAVNAAADEQCITRETSVGDFEYQECNPPIGTTTQVIYNDAGVLVGSSGLTFDPVTGLLSIGAGTPSNMELTDQASDCVDPAGGNTSVCTKAGQLCYRDTGGTTICGAVSTLDGLTDVTLTSPATGSALVKSAGDWVDGPIDLADTDAVSGTLADARLSANVSLLGQTIAASELEADSVTEPKLKAVDAPADEEVLTYETTTGDFEWQPGGLTSSTLACAVGLRQFSLMKSIAADGTVSCLNPGDDGDPDCPVGSVFYTGTDDFLCSSQLVHDGAGKLTVTDAAGNTTAYLQCTSSLCQLEGSSVLGESLMIENLNGPITLKGCRSPALCGGADDNVNIDGDLGPVRIDTQANALGMTSPYSTLVLGSAGNCPLYAIARSSGSNEPFTAVAGCDGGSTRTLYFGGGGWEVPDATSHEFYTAPTYTETNDTGVLRLTIESDGDVKVDNSNGMLGLAYSAAPSMNDDGEISIDSTDSQLVYRSGGATKVLHNEITECKSGLVLVAASDDVPFWSPGENVTLVRGWCLCSGTCTTPATVTFETIEADASVDAVGGTATCAIQGAAVTPVSLTSDNTVTALNLIRTDTTNTPAPGTDPYTICLTWTTDAQ